MGKQLRFKKNPKNPLQSTFFCTWDSFSNFNFFLATKEVHKLVAMKNIFGRNSTMKHLKAFL